MISSIWLSLMNYFRCHTLNTGMLTFFFIFVWTAENGKDFGKVYRLIFHSQRKPRLELHIKEVNEFGNHSSPHYKGTAVFYKITREMITKKWEQPLPYCEYQHQSPLCKLALTLPKVSFSLDNVRDLSFFPLTAYLLCKRILVRFLLDRYTQESLVEQFWSISNIQTPSEFLLASGRDPHPSMSMEKKKCLAEVFPPLALPKWYGLEKLLLTFQLYTSYILVLGVQNCKSQEH